MLIVQKHDRLRQHDPGQADFDLMLKNTVNY